MNKHGGDSNNKNVKRQTLKRFLRSHGSSVEKDIDPIKKVYKKNSFCPLQLLKSRGVCRFVEMSLVAYGSSDEESDEDVQNHQDDVKKPLLTKEGKDPAEGKGLFLPLPKQTSKLSSSSDRKSALSSVLPKPKNLANIKEERISEQTIPDDKTFSVSLETMLEDEEILEIEEEYEPIAKRAKKNTNNEVDNKPKSVGTLFSLLPAPWQAENTWQKKKENKISTAQDRKSKQPIKIAIPTAPKVHVL